MKKTVCKTPFWQLLKTKLNNLDATEFQAKIAKEKEIILIDVRKPDEFITGSLPNAININYLTSDLWESLEALDKNKSLLVFCKSGRRSIRVCTLLRNGGFDPTKIFNLDGGLLAFE